VPARVLSIRQSLFLSLTLLLLLTSGAILVVAGVGALRGAGALAQSAVDTTEEGLIEDLDRFLGEVERLVLVSRSWLESESLGPEDYARLNRLFQPLIERTPQLSSVLVARSDGSEFSILRDPTRRTVWQNRVVRPSLWGRDALIREWDTSTGETDESFESLDYDPRTRVYYGTAVAESEPGSVAWTPPTIFYVTRDPGITGGTWWSAPDGDTVVVAFDLLLMDLSRLTSSAEIGSEGVAFALTAAGGEAPRIVGLPALGADTSDAAIRVRFLTPGRAVPLPDADPVLPEARDLGSPPVAAAVEAWQGAGRVAGPLEFDVDGERWWASFRPRSVGTEALWIVVAAPESDFVGDLVPLARQVVTVAAFALLASLLLATWLARSYARPLEALARSSHRIARLELDEPPGVESRLKEVRGLADEQERMRRALDAFARYMPVELVRRLVSRGELARIGGTRRVITILFTDIEGFTTIAEARSPEAVTAHLTSYFEWLLDTLRAHRGEVNQLLGDGLMAYWGAPVESPDHARDAVSAILACRTGLEVLNRQWVEEGEPSLPTRFGVATGEVVVGNVGSPSRLAYAAVGDAVNLASRIEGMNRFYGTRLLVAGATRRAAGDGFEWRHVDGVRAKGKSKVVELHEPLGRTGEVPPDRLAFRDAYEEALARYRRRDFHGSIEVLDAIAAAYRDDRSVARLRGLCIEYLDDPPPEGWDGVTNLRIK
jgi:adenylate cyclase